MGLMTHDEAWATLRPLTRLGQVLAELKIEVEVPEDIPFGDMVNFECLYRSLKELRSL